MGIQGRSVCLWGRGVNSQVRKLRPKRLKQQFGFAGRLGWDTGLGSDGRGCFMTQATPNPMQELATPQRPPVPGRLRGDIALSADYGVLSTGEGRGGGGVAGSGEGQSEELDPVGAQGHSQ